MCSTTWADLQPRPSPSRHVPPQETNRGRRVLWHWAKQGKAGRCWALLLRFLNRWEKLSVSPGGLHGPDRRQLLFLRPCSLAASTHPSFTGFPHHALRFKEASFVNIVTILKPWRSAVNDPAASAGKHPRCSRCNFLVVSSRHTCVRERVLMITVLGTWEMQNNFKIFKNNLLQATLSRSPCF